MHTKTERNDTMGTILLCIKIFFARILDVSISTIRTVFVLKGKTPIVAMLAFIEITIWFLIVREALNVPVLNKSIFLDLKTSLAKHPYMRKSYCFLFRCRVFFPV